MGAKARAQLQYPHHFTNVMDHIGCHGQSVYTTKASEWIDGKKADVVYAPNMKATKS